MEYRGPWDDIEVPDVSLYGLVFDTLTPADEDKVAFEHAETDTVVTFGQLRRQVDAIATWLAAHGVGPGDSVAIAMTNCPEFAAATHGILRAGAAMTPINPASVDHEMARQLGYTHSKLVITSQALSAKVLAAAGEAGLRPEQVVVHTIDGDLPGATTGWSELVQTEPAPPQVDIDPATHIAVLPVSSGTSGLPKAVMLTHRNLVANVLQFLPVLESLGDDNSLVSFLPFSHIYAMTTNLNFGLVRRYPQYTMSSFQAPLFLQLVATRRPTMLFVVPPVATFLSRSPAVDKVDWSSVRVVVSGAAPLDQHVGEAVERRLGARVVQGYGMTELSPVTHVMPLDRPDIEHSTIGLAVPNVRFRVVDPETGIDVAAPATGEWSPPGELWVKGPNAMVGYLDLPEDSGSVKDTDGFVHTGDLVQVNDEGITRIVDRIKELIKRRGFQIAPVELEALLVTHPGVLDAAVLGIGRTSGDQVPHALLVLTSGTNADEVVAWLNGQVAQYKHLGGATVVDTIPRSAAGKILRRELPKLLPRS